MGESHERNEPTDPPAVTHVRPAREHEAHVEGVPETEGVTESDVAERLDADPDEQPNRPDQDMPEWERRQYDDPPLEKPLTEVDEPEDR